MLESNSNAIEFLRLLDHRQEQVLKDLDDLNQRVEKVLEIYQSSRTLNVVAQPAAEQTANPPRRQAAA